MRFEEKLKQKQYDQLWQEYCGFLDLDMKSYMQIQNRLLQEQILLWSNSTLGKSMIDGNLPITPEEFRKKIPLTTYGDYADILALKNASSLPGTPVVWIETTWEGGTHPVKVAPYTREMLNTYRNNVISIFMLSTSTGKGNFNIRPKDKMLYGLAPLPYATGLLPLLLGEEITLEFLPPVKSAEKMSFGERNKKGFELGAQKGIDLFFGLSSVISYISTSFQTRGQTAGKSKQRKWNYSPKMILRYLIASYRCNRSGRQLMPKDLFQLKGFVCAGTDSRCYKKPLEEAWGIRPLEISAGTEPTCVATESWEKNGMYFFPDACFYEFIPKEEMNKNLEDPNYIPRTYLMNEVVAHKDYELVVTVFKGGAFARYRVGDMYRCISTPVEGDAVLLPRFEFLDRVPCVIDIAGFTRITEATVNDVIKLSGLGIQHWLAKKEFNGDHRPFFHLYVELEQSALETGAVSRQLLSEHLGVYFKYFDHDYRDLKKLLGIEPLEITILKTGTFDQFQEKTGKRMRRMNPDEHDLQELIRFQKNDYLQKHDYLYQNGFEADRVVK